MGKGQISELEPFEAALASLPGFFASLEACPMLKMKSVKSWAGTKAVYVFYGPDALACHVGRTRNLQQRIRCHVADSHYSSSYAFKRTREALRLPVTYRKGEGRRDLLKRPDVQKEFEKQRIAIQNMTLKFVEIDNPIEQYLFELYAALRLKTSLTEFETS